MFDSKPRFRIRKFNTDGLTETELEEALVLFEVRVSIKAEATRANQLFRLSLRRQQELHDAYRRWDKALGSYSVTKANSEARQTNHDAREARYDNGVWTRDCMVDFRIYCVVENGFCLSAECHQIQGPGGATTYGHEGMTSHELERRGFTFSPPVIDIQQLQDKYSLIYQREHPRPTLEDFLDAETGKPQCH